MESSLLAKPASAAESTRSVNLVRTLMRALSRHWWQILLLWAVTSGGLCYVIMTRVKPVYRAFSLLRVEPNKDDIFGVGRTAGDAFGPFLETQVQLMKSPNVLSTVLNDPSIAALKIFREADDPEFELRDILKVVAVPNSYLLEVSAATESAQESAQIVNRVVVEYLAAASEWADSLTKAQIASLESYERELETQASDKRESLLSLASKANIVLTIPEDGGVIQGASNFPVPARSKMTVEEAKRLREQLHETRMKLSEAQAILSVQESEVTAPEHDERLEKDIERIFRAEPESQELSRRIKEAQLRLKEAERLSRSPNDPARLTQSRKVEELKKDFQSLYEVRHPVILAGLMGRGDQGGMKLIESRQRVQMLKAMKTEQEKALSAIDVVNRQDASDAVRISLIRDEYDEVLGLRGAVNKRLEQLRFDRKSTDRVSRVSEARATQAPFTDNRKKLLLVTPFAVLALVLGFFAMLELKIGRVSDLEDLARISPVEVFALPPLPGPRLDPGQRGAREREGRLQEFLQSLDHLRVALCEESSTNGATSRCLMITSSTASEGKTTLSAQLAACCAKAGMSTLLIDGDMRRATLSRMLNEEKTPGLSDVLQGEMIADDAAVPIPDAGFHLLPAGSPGRDPSWLLKGQRFGQLINRYRQMFDLIIIDTPPILPVPDALTMGRWTDGAVLASRFDVSRLPLVEKARRRVASAGIPLLKTVVNGVRTSKFYYGYGGYGYGYGYGYCYGYGYGYCDRERIAPPEASAST